MSDKCMMAVPYDVRCLKAPRKLIAGLRGRALGRFNVLFHARKI